MAESPLSSATRRNIAAVHDLLARERFHLDQWQASVAQRLGELDRLYTTSRGDLYDRRMLLLEVVVVFFAVDLLVLFFRK